MRGERDIIYKERGCWSSYQEDRTDTASQKWRNSFLRPEIPALMGFITAARILSLHFSAVFLQPLTGQGKGKRQGMIQELPAILRDKSFLAQPSAQGSYS